jgi:pre-rRNA-processing protein TSR3
VDPRFLVIRHRKENLKKCSLRHCAKRTDIRIIPYPLKEEILDIERYTLLDIDGEDLTSEDTAPFLLIDGTWKYAATMCRQIPGISACKKRKIPSAWRTAYPRRQTGCTDPERGLASNEAIFAVCCICGFPTHDLIDNYFWKDSFLEMNRDFLVKNVDLI